MFDLDAIDVDEIAAALEDQTDYGHRWLIDPRTGEVVFWTSDTGIDGENPVDLDELDLVLIDPVPSYVWYQDMVDFAEGIGDHAAGCSLSRSLNGKGAFRRSGSPCGRPGREPAPCDGWWTRDSSRKRPHANSRATIRSLPCRDPLLVGLPKPTPADGGRVTSLRRLRTRSREPESV